MIGDDFIKNMEGLMSGAKEVIKSSQSSLDAILAKMNSDEMKKYNEYQQELFKKAENLDIKGMMDLHNKMIKECQ